tara:strand:- start:274 stop:525 length:252 start_codon:yes stop_codon:yes gene_type:complete
MYVLLHALASSMLMLGARNQPISLYGTRRATVLVAAAPLTLPVYFMFRPEPHDGVSFRIAQLTVVAIFLFFACRPLKRLPLVT